MAERWKVKSLHPDPETDVYIRGVNAGCLGASTFFALWAFWMFVCMGWRIMA